MPDTQKLSTFDPNSVKPKVLIVSCSADISYVGYLKEQYFRSVTNPQKATDYMEFTHPGGFPVDDSLDAIVELMARFAIDDLAIISHIDCGLVDGVAKLTQPDQENPYLFSTYAKAVVKMLEESEVDESAIGSMNIGEVTTLLSKLVTSRVAKRMVERYELATEEIAFASAINRLNYERMIALKNCSIATYSFLGQEKGLVETISKFQPSQYKEKITF